MLDRQAAKDNQSISPEEQMVLSATGLSTLNEHPRSSYPRKPLKARRKLSKRVTKSATRASSTRFATSRKTKEASFRIMEVLSPFCLSYFVYHCWVARLGRTLEFPDILMANRQFLRTMRPLLGNKAEISDESVSKWYRYVTFYNS